MTTYHETVTDKLFWLRKKVGASETVYKRFLPLVEMFPNLRIEFIRRGGTDVYVTSDINGSVNRYQIRPGRPPHRRRDKNQLPLYLEFYREVPVLGVVCEVFSDPLRFECGQRVYDDATHQKKNLYVPSHDDVLPVWVAEARAAGINEALIQEVLASPRWKDGEEVVAP